MPAKISFYSGSRADETPRAFTCEGVVDRTLFKDNLKSWSGDHCSDYSVVPGILLCSRKLPESDATPRIIDIAPTVIKAFGLDVPKQMEGRPLI